ncbi:MAG: hypothetical protein WCI95_00375 [bacterium]
MTTTSYDDLIKRSFRLLTYHRRRIWWITSRLFILTLVLTAFSMAFRPKFVARTKMTILPTRSEIGFAAGRPDMFGSPVALLGQTYSETMTSRTLAEDVARTMLTHDKAELSNGGVLGHIRHNLIAPIFGLFGRAMTLLNTGRWETPDPFMSLVDTIQARTKVQNLPGSFVYQIAVTWENPKIAAAVANTLADRHVQMILQTNREEMRTTRDYIEAKIKESKADLAVLETKIKEYRVGEKLYASSTDMELGLQERSMYLRDLNATRVNRAQLDARIDALRPYQTPAALAAIEAERSELKMREAAVEKVIGDQGAVLDKLPAKEAGLLDLYRERLNLEHTISSLQDRLLDTKITELAQLSTARVIDRAIPPVYPEGPLLLRNAVASLIVGLLLSICYVLVCEAWRPGLRSRDDLGRDGGEIVGLMPYVVANGHGDPDIEPSGRLTEFFQSVAHGHYGTVAHRRTTKRHLEHLLMRLTDGIGARICMFASLNGGEGKTYLIEQLAKLARESGLKVLLVDANFGAPSLHLAFGKSQSVGMAEILSGAVEAKAVSVTVDGGLTLINAGLKRPTAQSKWVVEKVQQELLQLRAGYDLILIDTAALRVDSTVSRLLPLATDIVCVFDATKSCRSDADEVRQRLGSAAGRMKIIFNKKMHAGDHLFEAGTNGHTNGNGYSTGPLTSKPVSRHA